MLDPDVVEWTDTGGIAGAPRRAIAGRERVASQPGAAAFAGGEVIAVLAFETRDGLISRIHSIANPTKLARVRARLRER